MYMKNLILSLTACVTLLTLAIPAAGAAAEAPSTAHYSTAMTELYGSNSPYTGALDLTVTADGIIHGYYFPADYSAMFVPVVGGRSGDSIWFDIGSSQITHIDGRLQDGAIVGTAFTSANAQYTFVAKPTTQSAR
jgi:hypothetical protein